MQKIKYVKTYSKSFAGFNEIPKFATYECNICSIKIVRELLQPVTPRDLENFRVSRYREIDTEDREIDTETETDLQEEETA